MQNPAAGMGFEKGEDDLAIKDIAIESEGGGGLAGIVGGADGEDEIADGGADADMGGFGGEDNVG